MISHVNTDTSKMIKVLAYLKFLMGPSPYRVVLIFINILGYSNSGYAEYSMLTLNRDVLYQKGKLS